MNLVGQKIHHNVFGGGIVTEWNEARISARFYEGEKHFLFPDAFLNFLTLEDSTLQLEIDLLLAARKAAREEKLLGLKKEQERKALLSNFRISPQGQAVFDIKSDHLRTVFATWTVSTGHYISGASQGEVRIPERLKPNSMCLLTTCPSVRQERERHIVGAFMVEDDFLGEYCHTGIIQAHPEYRLQLPPEHCILFWPYIAQHAQRSRWGRSALKYMSNQLGEQVLFDIKTLPLCTESKAAAEEFYQYYCKRNRIPTRYEGGDPVAGDD